MKTIQDIRKIKHSEACLQCYATRKFFNDLKSRGEITDDFAVLFILDEVRPCRSQILMERDAVDLNVEEDFDLDQFAMNATKRANAMTTAYELVRAANRVAPSYAQ